MQSRYICFPDGGCRENAVESFKMSDDKGVHIRLSNGRRKEHSDILKATAQNLGETGNAVIYRNFFDGNLVDRLEYDKASVSSAFADSTEAGDNKGIERYSSYCNNQGIDVFRVNAVRVKQHLKARHYLGMAKMAGDGIDGIVKEHFNSEKALGAIGRICREGGKHRRRGKSEVARGNEEVTVGVLYACDGTRQDLPDGYFPYYIKDRVYASAVFLKLLNKAFANDSRAILTDISGRVPEGIINHKLQAVFIPYDESEVLTKDRHSEDYKIINLERFIDGGSLKEHKHELKFLQRCKDDFLHMACNSYHEAFVCDKGSDDKGKNADADNERIESASKALTEIIREVTEKQCKSPV